MSQSRTVVVPDWPRWVVCLVQAAHPYSFHSRVLADTMKKRICVYIDALNLYYFLLHCYPKLKWLDVVRLAKTMLGANHSVVRVKYYTAKFVDAPESNQQEIYWAALRSQKEVTIYEGKFRPVSRRGEPSDERVKQAIQKHLSPAPTAIAINSYEEKRTDVNLAVHLVRDALLKRFDAVAVVSNDSDFLEAIRIVKREAKLPIWLLSPVVKDSGIRGPHSGLRNIITPDFVKRITKKD
ncbi:MAG: NYN domain-containing protein, partial [Proteobacteria bacterium]|nr:NYN domain-containing protein [Pseudomonadota bacterium]